MYATQKGMNIGKQRHVTDINVDNISSQSHGLLHAQTGTDRLINSQITLPYYVTSPLDFILFLIGFSLL